MFRWSQRPWPGNCRWRRSWLDNAAALHFTGTVLDGETEHSSISESHRERGSVQLLPFLFGEVLYPAVEFLAPATPGHRHIAAAHPTDGVQWRVSHGNVDLHFSHEGSI